MNCPLPAIVQFVGELRSVLDQSLVKELTLPKMLELRHESRPTRLSFSPESAQLIPIKQSLAFDSVIP